MCGSVERGNWESTVVVWATAIVTGCRVCVGIHPEDKRKENLGEEGSYCTHFSPNNLTDHY